DEDWDATYYGGDKDNWFSVSQDGPNDGDATRWNYLTGGLIAKDMTQSANYAELQQYLDVSNFSDYLLLNWFKAQTDWTGNNFWAGNNNNPVGPTPYAAWDGE